MIRNRTIANHRILIRSTEQLGSFLSGILSVHLATSAFCICASIYCMTFVKKFFLKKNFPTNIHCYILLQNHNATVMELTFYINYLIFSIYDIFMAMYYGTEIKVSSERLLYALFESNWLDRSQSCKKCMIIFGERLKQAQELIIFKLYPLTLETFRKVIFENTHKKSIS